MNLFELNSQLEKIINDFSIHYENKNYRYCFQIMKEIEDTRFINVISEKLYKQLIDKYWSKGDFISGQIHTKLLFKSEDISPEEINEYITYNNVEILLKNSTFNKLYQSNIDILDKYFIVYYKQLKRYKIHNEYFKRIFFYLFKEGREDKLNSILDYYNPRELYLFIKEIIYDDKLDDNIFIYIVKKLINKLYEYGNEDDENINNVRELIFKYMSIKHEEHLISCSIVYFLELKLLIGKENEK